MSYKHRGDGLKTALAKNVNTGSASWPVGESLFICDCQLNVVVGTVKPQRMSVCLLKTSPLMIFISSMESA